MTEHAALEPQEEHEYIGIVGEPEDPKFVDPDENEDLGTIKQPIDPETRACWGVNRLLYESTITIVTEGTNYGT